MIDERRWTDEELELLRFEGVGHLNHLLSGDATAADLAEIDIWREQSPAHELAFRSAIRLRRVVHVAEGVASPATIGIDNVVSLADRQEKRASRRVFLGGAVAASIGGAVLLTGRSFDMIPTLQELNATYRTSAGERRLVHLDGSATIELNTRTSVTLRPDRAMLTAELISGEAIVTSRRDGTVALIAGEGIGITTNGQFSASLIDGEGCLTCLSGEVLVRWRGERRRLLAAQEVRYTGRAMGPVGAGANTRALTAWRSGTLVFEEMPMRRVVQEINRYRSGRVLLTNAALGERRLSGTYEIARLNEFFNQAELVVGAKVLRLPGDVVVLS